jgi:hypothetical protein
MKMTVTWDAPPCSLEELGSVANSSENTKVIAALSWKLFEVLLSPTDLTKKGSHSWWTFRFSRRWLWKLLSSGMLRWVVWYKLTDVQICFCLHHQGSNGTSENFYQLYGATSQETDIFIPFFLLSWRSQICHYTCTWPYVLMCRNALNLISCQILATEPPLPVHQLRVILASYAAHSGTWS